MVSVPSTGRSGLQLVFLTIVAFALLGFSTLYGSKWVATGGVARRKATTNRFQYPLRVEVGCNWEGDSVGGFAGTVSVPSTGRSGLQLCRRWIVDTTS